MQWITRIAHACVLGLIPAILILPGCSTIRGLQREPAVGKVTTAPPAPEPAVQPELRLPKTPEPEMPKVASRMPNTKNAAPKKKPAPLKAPPLPKLAERLVIAPADLVGFDFSSVLHVLRRPDSVRTNALSIVWTYSEPSCTLQLFFYPEIQTKIFRLLKHDLRSASDGEPERKACMRDIMAMKTDEPATP